MKTAIAAFTARGAELAVRLGAELHAALFAPKKYAGEGISPMEDGLRDWAKAAFYAYDALVFIGATGIAVRAVAPYLEDKLTDPAMVVIDEHGQYVIPILSGHIGGANELARKVASLIGAIPVITTATDRNGIPAIDSWAVQNDMAIENPRAIKSVSGAALNGEAVGVAITERLVDPPFPVTLFLRPRTLTVGIGCKRGIDSAHLETCLMAFLRECGVSLLSIGALATIDRKSNEKAILDLSGKYQIPLACYSANELREVPGSFSASDWVQKTVGVDNVCERAAVKHSDGRLLKGKTIYEGVTLALAAKEENI